MKGKIKQIGIIIGKYLLLITFWILSIVLADSLTPILNEQGKPISTFFFEFIPFLGLVIGHFVMTKVFEKSTFDFVRVNKDNLLKNVVYGILFGLLWLTVSVIIICLLGNGKLNNSFTLTAGQLLLFFFVLFINASMQELLVHGYLFSLLESKYSKLTALIATSFLFLLLHPGAINSGLTASINVFGAGLIFGLITIKFDSLICATFAHTVWNYFGAVWFGLIPLDNYPSMKLISVTGNSLLIGDKNGMETGFIVTVTMLTFVMYLWTRKQQVTRYWQKQG
ncbi:MAG: CPBP family intramembrane metalloprotease [Flavobacteriales bacterium]|nr:CPBP family intramembrane metalloprotease [Flavobacteriales bacterium]